MEHHFENEDDIAEELNSIRDGIDYILHLNYKGLEEMPATILEEKAYLHVRRIYMKQNRLKTLPEDIGQLKNLVELYLHSNEISSLPRGIGDLLNLESIDLSHNNLNSLPGCIGNLQNLETLQLSNNNIRDLPREIGKLQKLQVLDVMYNNIKYLPPDICSCTSLQRLLVDRNELRWLPNEICHMTKLEEMSAASNHLLYLPLDIGDMESLKSVYVDNNPFLHAMPLTIDRQEIGFSSCGDRNYTDMCDDFNNITIHANEDTDKVVYLPKGLQIQGDGELFNVPTLLELSLRASHRVSKQGQDFTELPRSVLRILQHPICHCPCCRTPIFTMGYPMVFDGQIRLYSLYRLCICCSDSCVKLASLLINLPLLHPSACQQNMAVVLVDGQND